MLRRTDTEPAVQRLVLWQESLRLTKVRLLRRRGAGATRQRVRLIAFKMQPFKTQNLGLKCQNTGQHYEA